MLNGWDVCAIIVVGFIIMGVINKIGQTIVASKAVKQCAAIGVSEKEFYNKVDKIIEKALLKAQKDIIEKSKELDKETLKETIKIVDAESKKIALEIDKVRDVIKNFGMTSEEAVKNGKENSERTKEDVKKTPVKRTIRKKTTKE